MCGETSPTRCPAVRFCENAVQHFGEWSVDINAALLGLLAMFKEDGEDEHYQKLIERKGWHDDVVSAG